MIKHKEIDQEHQNPNTVYDTTLEFEYQPLHTDEDEILVYAGTQLSCGENDPHEEASDKNSLAYQFKFDAAKSVATLKRLDGTSATCVNLSKPGAITMTTSTVENEKSEPIKFEWIGKDFIFADSQAQYAWIPRKHDPKTLTLVKNPSKVKGGVTGGSIVARMTVVKTGTRRLSLNIDTEEISAADCIGSIIAYMSRFDVGTERGNSLSFGKGYGLFETGSFLGLLTAIPFFLAC